MSHPLDLDARHTALLALDFQDTILGFLPDPIPLLSKVHRAVKATRDAGGAVGLVRVAFEPHELEAFPSHSAMGQRMRAAWPKVSASALTTAIRPELAPCADDILIRKTRVGAFAATDLEARLKARAITTLVLAGVHTSGAVLSTLRAAHDLDYRVLVLSDGCADPEAEMHTWLLERVFPRQGLVCDSQTYIAALQAWGAR